MKRLALTLGLAVALLASSSVALAGPPSYIVEPTSTTVWVGFVNGDTGSVRGEAGPLATLDGKWTIGFKAAKSLKTGKYTWKHNGAFVVSGNFKISGSTVTFKDRTAAGKGDSFGCRGRGKYRFKLTGKKLKFTLISDPANSCHRREIVLTYGPFTKV